MTGGRVEKRYSVEKPLRKPSTKVQILSGGHNVLSLVGACNRAPFFVYSNNAAPKRYSAPNYAGLPTLIPKEVIYEGSRP